MHFVCNCIKFKEYVLNHFQNLRNGGKGTFQDIFSPIVDKPLGYKPSGIKNLHFQEQWELCMCFFGRPVREYVRGATSRILKFDAKDK